MLSHEYCPQISITSRLFFSVFFFKVYLLTSDLFVDSVNSSVAWLNVRCWGGSGGTVRGGQWEA